MGWIHTPSGKDKVSPPFHQQLPNCPLRHSVTQGVNSLMKIDSYH